MKNSDIRFRVAHEAEVPAVIAARAQIYLEELGLHADDGNDQSGYHIIAATRTEEIVAGVRLLGPELRPFDFESTLDLSAAAHLGARPALLGRLFLRRDFRAAATSAYVLRGLLGHALTISANQSITDLYIYSFGHLLALYRRAGFESLGITIYHEHWRTLYLMRLSVLHPSPVSA